LPIRYVIKSVTGSAPDAAALNGRALAAATGEPTVRRRAGLAAVDRDAVAGAIRLRGAAFVTLTAMRASGFASAPIAEPAPRDGRALAAGRGESGLRAARWVEGRESPPAL
jgi:hypothetical protein